MRRTIPIFLLILVTLATFSRLPVHEFVLTDDRGNIFENPHFEKDAPTGIGYFWKHSYFQLYVPLTYTVWGLLVKLAYAAGWAANLAEVPAGPFHVVNLLCHVGAVLALYGIVRRLFPDGRPVEAAMAAALFAIHPLQVEPVAWATGLKDVLSGFLGLTAVWLYLGTVRVKGKGRRAKSKGRRAEAGSKSGTFAIRSGSKLYALCALLFFALALLAKPTALVVPFMATALAVMVLKIRWARVINSLWPWFALALVSVFVTRIVQSTDGESSIAPLWARPFIAADALWFYLCKLIAPAGLTPMYERSAEGFVQSFGIVSVLPLLFWAAMAVALLRWKTLPGRAVILAGLALWIAGFLPVLGFLPFDFQKLSTVADRYNYFSLAGVAIGVAYALTKIKGAWTFGILGVVVAACSVLSHAQARHWKDASSFIEHAISERPESAFLAAQRGILAVREERFDAAVAAFKQSLQLEPDRADSHYNIGVAYARQKRYAEAVPHFRRAVELVPGDEEYHLRLGMSLLGTGAAYEATTHLQKAGPRGREMLEQLRGVRR